MKYALRQLLKSPAFTVIALLTLALGIGVNATTFTLTNAILNRLPGFAEPGRLVEIFGTQPQNAFATIAPANVRDMIQQSTVFEQMTPWCFQSFSLAQPGAPATRVSGLSVGGRFFGTLGVRPLLGRLLTPSDEGPGHYDVIAVSERFWKANLGGDPQVVGKTVRLDGIPVTVVGVMPESCQDYMSWGPVDIWQPVGYSEDGWEIRNNAWLNVAARLKPGVSLAQAQAELSTIAARLAHDHPEVNTQRGLSAVPYELARVGNARRITWIMMGLMVFVLLIACVNLANLQLARAATRAREHAVRIALGASRSHLIRQLLAESVLLSIAGGALGLLVAVWGNKLLGSRLTISSDAPGFELPLDYRVVGFTLAISVATGILFGLTPALIASRTDVNLALKQSGRGTSGDRSKHRMRHALVVSELALALVVLTGASFFVRSVMRYGRSEPGWKFGSILTGSFVLSYNTYKTDDQVRSAIDKIQTALSGVPGVDRVSIAGSIPVFTFSNNGNFAIEGQPSPQGKEPLAEKERITTEYFDTLGIHLLSGREFTPADRATTKQVVIINQAMANQFWPKGDALGHRIGSTDPKNPQWREIVGIVNNVRFPGNTGPLLTPFQTYHPMSQDPEHWLTFAARYSGQPGAVIDDARHAVARVDADLAVYNAGTVESTLAQSAANIVLVGQLMSIAAALGLLLALVGIYGVVANLAVQRTQEIGIRMALGAESFSVLWLVLRNGARLAAVGTGIGLVLAFALSRGLELALPGFDGQDPLLIVAMAALLVVATLFACWLPARRATRVNPVEALRAE